MPTVLDSLLASLQKAADYNRDDTVPPAAVLWPDEKRESEKLVPRLRSVLPQLLIFGPYDTAHRSGPAIWLCCVLAGKIADVTLPAGTVPIIYLPGVSRATLRATEECPHDLKPLAELQYRGVIWSQANAKDWTIAAYLQTEKGGLHLTMSRDQATTTSLRRALEKLADVPLTDLQAKSAARELNSNYFDSLVSDDLVVDLLSWMSQPKETRSKWESSRWETLRTRCIQPSHQFVALPSVTPTSKPVVSPVATKIKGTVAGEEFRPCVAHDGKDLTPDRLRKLLADVARWARTAWRSSWSRRSCKAKTRLLAIRFRPVRFGRSVPAIRTKDRTFTGSRSTKVLAAE